MHPKVPGRYLVGAAECLLSGQVTPDNSQITGQNQISTSVVLGCTGLPVGEGDELPNLEQKGLPPATPTRMRCVDTVPRAGDTQQVGVWDAGMDAGTVSETSDQASYCQTSEPVTRLLTGTHAAPCYLLDSDSVLSLPDSACYLCYLDNSFM